MIGFSKIARRVEQTLPSFLEIEKNNQWDNSEDRENYNRNRFNISEF